MITFEELEKYLNEKEADYAEINQPLYKEKGNIQNAVYDIEIHWGDWKHSWGYLRWLMEQIGYQEVNVQVTEEDGSDCFSGIGRYVEKNTFNIFNKLFK